jgi:hypothetical protein
LTIDQVKKAAFQFGFDPTEKTVVQSLGNGLINYTYTVSDPSVAKAMVLQAINRHVFSRPEDILHNYKMVYDCLKSEGSSITIPSPLSAATGHLYWVDDQDNCWRACEFIGDSYSPSTAADQDAAYTVANCFAKFTSALSVLKIRQLREIIPGFHNLAFRYTQFEEAIAKASITQLLRSTHVIAELRGKKKLVDFYESMQGSLQYPDRVMHHDCKISNILFDKKTNSVICPVDLDTVMPGKFFSDPGDMIRSMACTVDENATSWEEINIRPPFYKAILEGYLEGIGGIFTGEEKANIHYAGLLMTFMQSLRFAADFLNGDVYYKIQYPEQNLNRALNQLILLEKLETFLEAEYGFTPY